MHRTKGFTVSCMLLLTFLIAVTPALEVSRPVAQAQDGEWDFYIPLAPLGDPPVAEGQLSESRDTESVIAPTDGRKRVTNTTSPQYRWVVKLEPWFGGTRYTCTGYLLGPRLVATAGRCVYNGGWVGSIRVIPAQNGVNEPYSSQMAEKWYVPDEWVASYDPLYDFALIVLPDTTMGDAVGVFLSTSYFSDYFIQNDLKGKVSVTGYPVDKVVGGFSGFSMWTGSGDFMKSISPVLNYNVDTYSGQDGAAVVATYQGKKFALATHRYGVSGAACSTDPVLGPMNCGVRMDLNWWALYGQVHEDYAPPGENLFAGHYTDSYPAPVVTFPENNLLTNQPVTFSWNEALFAAKYQLTIEKWDSKSGAYKPYINKKLTGLSWTKNLPTGYYRWHVRIEQANKFPGQYSTSRYLEVDKKKPSRPALVYPSNNFTLDVPANFEWSETPDEDHYRYVFQIKPKGTSWEYDASTTYVIENEITLGVISDGIWSWRVRSLDEVGNWSSWSATWNVTIDSTLAISIGDEPVAPVTDASTVPPPPLTQSHRVPVLIPVGEPDPGQTPPAAPDGTPVIPIG